MLNFVLIAPSGEQLWVKTIQGYWLLSLGNLLRQKRATISCDYTRNVQGAVSSGDKKKEDECPEYTNAESQDKYMEKLSGKTLVVTCGNSCYHLSSEVVQPISELESTQEEADTRMLLHSLHAARSRFASVVIISEDTHVLVLLLAR